MTASPFVPVEGPLARPSPMPFSGLPFGREWTRLADCRAQLRTCFVDLDAPHRSCQWQPSRPPPPAGDRTAPAAPIVLIPPPAGQHRVLRGIGCALGAFGLIGWLVWSQTDDGATPLMQSGRVIAHAPASVEASPPRAKSARAHASRTESSPADVADQRPITPPSVAHAVARPESPYARTVQHRPAATETRSLARSPRRDAAPHRLPAPAMQVGLPARQASPAPVDDPSTLAEWQALYATLRADAPRGAPTSSPAATGDWPSQLQHRRLTAAPESFTR